MLTLPLNLKMKRYMGLIIGIDSATTRYRANAMRRKRLAVTETPLY